MKKGICLLGVLILTLCGCGQPDPSKESVALTEIENPIITKNESGNVITVSGVEYTFLAMEPDLYYVGELEFIGAVQGEKQSFQHLGYSIQTGVSAIKNNDNILIRTAPDNEFFSIYRKSTLPAYDFSVDNCIRLEFVPEFRTLGKDAIHATCGSGIADRDEIRAFLSEIRSQKHPREAGFYDLVRKPDGFFENCYFCGEIYGFFAGEENVAVLMSVLSYNDLAYSIMIGENEYVLPESWLEKLTSAQCNS